MDLGQGWSSVSSITAGMNKVLQYNPLSSLCWHLCWLAYKRYRGPAWFLILSLTNRLNFTMRHFESASVRNALTFHQSSEFSVALQKYLLQITEFVALREHHWAIHSAEHQLVMENTACQRMLLICCSSRETILCLPFWWYLRFVVLRDRLSYP